MRLPRLRSLRDPKYAAAAFAVFILTVGAVMVPTPAPAGAIGVPTPADVLNGLPGVPNLDPVNWAVDAFKGILNFVFGDQVERIGRSLVSLLLAIPILTDERSFPELNEYRSYVTGAAWAFLALSFVVSSMRFWLSSFGGTGTYEAMQGFIRTAGAIAILLLFPMVFDQVSRLVNAFTSALVINPVVGNGIGKGLVGTLTIYSGGGMAMLFGIAAIIMAMILLVVKVTITALLAVLWVLSPLAVSLWPIPELDWALRSLVQAMFALLIFPVLWALCFATFAVLNVDAMFPGDHGDITQTVLSPAIGLASLVIAFRLPFAVLEQAMSSSITPGMRSAGYAARAAAAAVRVRG